MSLIIGLATQSAAALFEIPRAFWGEYNEVLRDCGTGNNEGRLRITWDRIQFYESEGQLRGLIRHPDGSLTVLAQHRGEGQAWYTAYSLRLSPDGSRLTMTHMHSSELGQSDYARLRCPSR